MPEVILDGPCAGMTEKEYEKMRFLDCRVAIGLGWRPANGGFDSPQWIAPCGTELFRDEEMGVPLYSLNMNGAHEVLKTALLTWNYRAREKFFEKLQERASYDMAHDSKPAYPDCLVSLVADLPEHICLAFANVYEYEVSRGLDPYQKSKVATEYVDSQIEQPPTYVETDDQGVDRVRFNPKPKSTPWVVDARA
jgi:hypothetical protein